MKRFKNILFYADGNTDESPAFLRALELAKANQAKLTLFDVLEKMQTPSGKIGSLNQDLGDIVVGQYRHQLKAMADAHQVLDQPIECQVKIGHSFVEVIHAVLHDGFDLVVKAAHPPEARSLQLRGSTDMHLLRKCPCPVWIDKPDATRPYKRVLAAVDPLAEEGASCARLVMDLATSMALRESASVSVLHAWQLLAESTLRSSMIRVSEEELQQLLRDEEAVHRDALDKLLEPYGLHSSDKNVHLQKGKPSVVIAEQCAALQPDLIVMGTVGRTGIPGFIIGNTAEDVLQATNSSVLAVKPDGFVSPLG